MWILFPVLGILAILLIAVSLQPSSFEVIRSLKMKAPPENIFEQVNDPKLLIQWNPWVKLDPDVKQTFEGATRGQGAIYSWDGNKNVGAGRQTIVESRPNELIRMKLEFFRPFAGENEVIFTFEPTANNDINVTWRMTGKKNFMMKAMGLILSMDKMCGDGFEKGLADIKRIVES